MTDFQKQFANVKKDIENATKGIAGQIGQLKSITEMHVVAKETRFVKGAMIQLMGDGSVNVKFENEKDQKEFYDTVLNG